jgi:mannose-1-phosphate guanylyltransferase
MIRRHEWAVVLAGGEGVRLRALTRLVAGDERPKQFCRLLGQHTLLAATRQRVGLTVHPSRILYVVSRHHEGFYRDELDTVAPSRVIEQPMSRGTTTAIAYALARLATFEQAPLVGFFPADHHYEEPSACQRSLTEAFAAASQDRHRVYLIGAEPDHPEIEYGWIERGDEIPGLSGRAWQVAGFVEKPTETEALMLMRRRCLWNTFMLVGRHEAFVSLLESARPGLFARCVEATSYRDPMAEAQAMADVYASVPTSDFSHDVLASRPHQLGVMRLPAAGWTDLGQPARVLEALAARGRLRPAADLVAS